MQILYPDVICRYTGNHSFGTKCKALISSSSSANTTLPSDGWMHMNQLNMTSSQSETLLYEGIFHC